MPGVAERILSMPPQSRRMVRATGVLLIAAGAAFLALGFASFLRFGTGEAAGVSVSMFVYFAVGALVLIGGVFFLRMGIMKPQRGGVGAGGAVADRWDEKAGTTGGPVSMDVFCPVCGHPERGGARHCSECGTRI